MPTDLYQWEARGGLVHHCPKCFKPLTTPQARSRCLGQHVEWCRRYHTQLFKKGSSGQCRPCRQSDEQHHERHCEIAKLVHKLAELNSIASSTTTPTPGTPQAVQSTEDPAMPKTKKERKAAKKAKKRSDAPVAVNAATIEHIHRILHPHECDIEDEELELALLNDPEINDNRFFHKGTSNVREVRSILVKRDRKGDKVVFRVEAAEMEGLLQLLNVSPVTSSTTQEERKIIDELKQKIEKDLVQAQEEQDGLMMRKAGFWRWASKKAYNRLVANGRIWEDKGDDSRAAGSDESVGSTEGDADAVFSAVSGEASDDTNITEPDSDGTAEAVESVSTLSLTTPKTPRTIKATTATTPSSDQGWTSVSSSKKTKGSGKAKEAIPKMTLKLSANNGLSKMVQSSTPRSTSFLRYHNEDD